MVQKDTAIVLQNLGFTPAEARVYVTLLQSGPVKVGHIIEKSGLQSSTVHNTLHALIDKGYITYIRRGKIKIYQAVHPSLILTSYQEKEQAFVRMIPQLEALEQLEHEKQQAEIYEGFKGMITMLTILIEDAQPNENYYFFATDQRDFNAEIQTFFERYDRKREEKQLNVMGLARKELKPFFENRRILHMRYVMHPIPTNISICHDKMALITWGEKPTGILIQSKPIIESQIQFFKGLWENASP